MNKLWVFVGAAILVTVYLGIPLLNYLYSGDSHTAARVGDAFGPVNAAFSGIGILVVVVTIWTQQKQLQLQQDQFQRNLEAQQSSAVSQSRLVQAQLLTAVIQADAKLIEEIERDLEVSVRPVEELRKRRSKRLEQAHWLLESEIGDARDG